MMSEILELEKLLAHIIAKNDFSDVSPTGNVSFSWGDQFELIQWMVMKGKEGSGLRAFQMKNDAKYPLIWLVHTLEGRLTGDGNFFEGIQIIIAMDTKVDWLNSTREHETMPILTKIANHFLSILDMDKNASIRKRNGAHDVRFKKIYNYQEFSPERFKNVENASATFDPWDAITLKFDLSINNNCLKTLKLCQS